MSDEQAAVAENAGPETVQENAEPTTEQAQDATQVEEQANAEQSDEQPEEHKGKRLGGWQRKIQKLQQQNEMLMEMLQSKAESAKPDTDKPADDKNEPPEPKIEDFKTWEEYEAANRKYVRQLAQHEAKKLFDEHAAEQERKTQEKTVQQKFREQVDTAKKQIADFSTIWDGLDEIPLSQAMHDAIVTSDYGALIAYELGKNPDEAERIAKLAPIVAVREIGKLEAAIADRKSAAVKREEAEPPTSKAPRPPEPVRKAKATDQGLSDDLPYKEWLRRREAELKRT